MKAGTVSITSITGELIMLRLVLYYLILCMRWIMWHLVVAQGCKDNRGEPMCSSTFSCSTETDVEQSVCTYTASC